MSAANPDEQIGVLERRVRILTRLAEMSAVLNSTLKLKPLLTTIMDTAAEIVDSEAASVLLWDGKLNELRFAATTTSDGVNLVGKLVPLEGSIAGTVMRENRIIEVTNVEHDPRHYTKIDQATQFVTRSILGVPMRSKNRVIGVLEAINKRELPWTNEDKTYLSILAAQAAVAIEGAQLVSALTKANDELNQLDKMKSDFIAIASHELRTPLGIILGYGTFLQEAQDEEVRGLAMKVVNSALQLRRIIEDLTNLRYLEQKTAELTVEDVPLDQFLSTALGEAIGMAEAKGHQVVHHPAPPETFVRIDVSRMGMAVANVLFNAVRFTPDNGRIEISSETKSREVWVRISDNGIGIERDNLERIFERFVQVEDHMTRKQGGMGIGLSIARALVEAHGGRIWATSPGINQGATFTITMPLA